MKNFPLKSYKSEIFLYENGYVFVDKHYLEISVQSLEALFPLLDGFKYKWVLTNPISCVFTNYVFRVQVENYDSDLWKTVLPGTVYTNTCYLKRRHLLLSEFLNCEFIGFAWKLYPHYSVIDLGMYFKNNSYKTGGISITYLKEYIKISFTAQKLDTALNLMRMLIHTGWNETNDLDKIRVVSRDFDIDITCWSDFEILAFLYKSNTVCGEFLLALDNVEDHGELGAIIAIYEDKHIIYDDALKSIINQLA